MGNELRAILTVGISASGKSTFATNLVSQGWLDVNRDFIRFNLVSPGSDWRTYKFSKANESEVTKIQEQMIMSAWGQGQNIIISDTNLSAKVRTKLTKQLSDLGYTIEVVPLPITLTEAWKRDAFRHNGVGHDVIYNQWQKWNEFVGRKTYIPNENLRSAVIVDIDGTVAEMDGRGPFDWNRVGEDKPREFVLEMVYNYYRNGYHIIFLSGRSDECFAETHNWLLDNFHGRHDGLFMRKAGDFRKDDVVKEEIFWTNIADKYNVVAAIDDRPQVLRLWLDLKIPNVISVGNPYLEF